MENIYNVYCGKKYKIYYMGELAETVFKDVILENFTGNQLCCTWNDSLLILERSKIREMIMC